MAMFEKKNTSKDGNPRSGKSKKSKAPSPLPSELPQKPPDESQVWLEVETEESKESKFRAQQMAREKAALEQLSNRKPLSEAEILKERAKRARSRERWIKTRMWISIISAKYFRDRGTIPPNIGNNIFIGNNQITTKNFITCCIYIQDFGTVTPIGFQSELIRAVRDTVKNASIDFTTKTVRYKPDLQANGMKSRINQWRRILDAPVAPSQMKERAARCMYTIDILKNKTKCFRAHNYILVRSDNGHDLDLAISAVRAYLYGLGIRHKEIRDDMDLHFKYVCMMSDTRDAKLRDLSATILSTRTIAELLPTLQGLNDKRGFMLGFDNINNSPYYIDEQSISGAKTFLVAGPSGRGKTFLVLTWCQDRFNAGMNLMVRDLKGNEFSSLTKAFGGISISLSEEDLYYINFFNLTDIIQEGEAKDFRERISLCSELIRLVVSPPPELAPEVSMIIDSFISSMFRSLGVMEGNPHTWARTADLNPFVVYEKFLSFAGPEMREKHSKLIEYISGRMSIYMSAKGSKSHIFRMPLSVRDFRKSRMITYNFGMLDSKATYDDTIFRIKFFFSDYIADDYISYKKSIGEWTMIVNEEAQLAEEYVAQACKKDATMRRSQNVLHVLLCNSIIAIAKEPAFKAVLGNTQVLAIGAVTEEDREYLIQQYSLDKYRKVMAKIVDNPKFYRTFLLVNKLQPNATTALLQAYIPEEVARGKTYTVVDVKDSEDPNTSISGIAQEHTTKRSQRKRR